ncbi:MAG TPA: hypothetical protein GXX39_02480 [Syntrophothermus lipocalidus]|nr:hypothetical protein [Syntrophothermus lipocalidus]
MACTITSNCRVFIRLFSVCRIKLRKLIHEASFGGFLKAYIAQGLSGRPFERGVSRH